MKIFRLQLILLTSFAGFLSACAHSSGPSSRESRQRLWEYVLTQTDPGKRDIQSQQIVAKDAAMVLSAAANALKDLGFAIDRVDEGLGWVTASKTVKKPHADSNIGNEFFDFFGVVSNVLFESPASRRDSFQGRPSDKMTRYKADLILLPRKEGSVTLRLRIKKTNRIAALQAQGSWYPTEEDTDTGKVLRIPAIYSGYFRMLSVVLNSETEPQ